MLLIKERDVVVAGIRGMLQKTYRKKRHSPVFDSVDGCDSAGEPNCGLGVQMRWSQLDLHDVLKRHDSTVPTLMLSATSSGGWDGSIRDTWESSAIAHDVWILNIDTQAVRGLLETSKSQIRTCSEDSSDVYASVSKGSWT